MATITRKLFSGDNLTLAYAYDDVSLQVQNMTLDCSVGTAVHVTATNAGAPILDQTYDVAPSHVVYDLTPVNLLMIHRTVKGQDLVAFPLTVSVAILGG